jgi:hypothetical protein
MFKLFDQVSKQQSFTVPQVMHDLRRQQSGTDLSININYEKDHKFERRVSVVPVVGPTTPDDPYGFRSGSLTFQPGPIVAVRSPTASGSR